jgi:hypothetical protein
MFTDEQRAEIREAMRAAQARAPAPIPVEVVNQPVQIPVEFPAIPEYPDIGPFLEEIAVKIEGVKGHTVARSIDGLKGTPEAILAIQGVLKAIPDAIGKIPQADVSKLVKAIEQNTKAVNELAAIQAAPKMLVLNRNGKPIGIRMAEGDELG